MAYGKGKMKTGKNPVKRDGKDSGADYSGAHSKKSYASENPLKPFDRKGEGSEFEGPRSKVSYKGRNPL